VGFLYIACLIEPSDHMYMSMSIQEEKVAILLSLLGELAIGIDVVEAVKEVFQLFQSVRLL